ncbi:MAG: glycosyltransferase family 2 protein [Clostridium sp.]|nr:glycosyltransferase family 2 protein [Clostridium sp.]
MGKKASLSLCMIVKDEGKTLERCLNSVKSFINEIIIVDTGSKDNTVEIAKKFNAKIYKFKWIDDFSAARNFAFSKATSDYIMWLDGDDFINEDDIKKIESLLSNMDSSYDYISAEYILARNSEGKVSTSLRRNRIVKRQSAFLWVGNVHEYLAVYGKGLEGNFSIEHGKVKEYTDRNLQIFKTMEKNNKKFTPRDIYYYANELFDNGYYKESINQYNKFIDTKEGWIEDIKGAYLKIIRALNLINEKDKIVDVALESLKIDTPTAEIACSLGEYYFEKENYNQAHFGIELH